MNFSETFIRRPVATVLLTLAVALAGAVAFRLLPVAPLPQVDFPTILVNANMAGASPEIMGSAVATPLERVLGRIAGVTEMTSTSSLGSTSIVLQFDIDRDIDGAARDVQAAINAARSLLPTDLSNNPTYRKVNPADAPVMILALSSPTMKRGDIYDVASTILAQKLSQILGVGQVLVGGGALPAVRVDLNPDALARNGIALESVRTALASSNANRPKGTVEEGERSWQIGANDQARKAAEYLPLIIGYRNGAAVRLSEVAQVTDSVEDVRNAGFSNGKPAVLVILFRQPGANIIETVDRVREALPGLQASLPGAVDMRVVMDRTPTIRASLREVERSLAISVCLVVLVVFLFLRNGRATLIPSVAVPVSLIGTFGIMYLCDYSLDNLSLMALTIATGFVVDDAIVVLENISRHIEDGMTPFRAAIRGAREVGFTVLSISLSLVAVFIPILLMGGIVGRMFREFAVTLSAAIMVSLLVSLTTTPMLCAHFLRGRGPEREEGRFHAFTGRLLGALQGGYAASLAFALRHRRLTICCLAATVAFNVYLYVVVPKGFFPQQDTGRVSGSIQADQSISFQAMRGKLLRLMDTVRQDPAVEEVAGFTGGSERNGGRVFISLKPLSERGVSIDGFIGRIRGKLMREPGAALLLQGAQDVRVGGRQSRAQYQYTLQSDDLAALRLWTARLEQALKPLPILADVNSDQQDRGLQTTVAVDRDKASRLGVTMRQVDAALNDAFGQRLASTIYTERNQYRVVMEVNPAYLENPDGLLHVHVPGASGELVPLNSFAEFKPDLAPLAVNHQGQSAAATVSFNIRPGASLSDVTRAIEEARQRIGMPESVHGGFQGTARVFQDSLRTQPWLILAALVSLYIVLGVLYESYIHPVTILSTLPSAGVGALLALMACGTEFSIIALIGVLLLAGIVKKNAIMMIDFAIDAERREGLDPEAAITRACLLRFRPIMMTTMAALFGALPLALGAGDGAELRRPLGIAIVGGLAMSQLLTLYTTPVVYLYLDRFRLWCKGFWRAFQPRVAPSGPHAAGDGTPPNP